MGKAGKFSPIVHSKIHVINSTWEQLCQPRNWTNGWTVNFLESLDPRWAMCLSNKSISSSLDGKIRLLSFYNEDEICILSNIPCMHCLTMTVSSSVSTYYTTNSTRACSMLIIITQQQCSKYRTTIPALSDKHILFMSQYIHINQSFPIEHNETITNEQL